ncbi:hypothetical protein AO1008_07016 [Aspergillus oryzae 100-8]|uniref:Uncharacterized protein n=1 Tax=Aspergillus oryzae (strain 3.042) TaxID=1160506 RepID=I8U0A8_ASPO3|nr:hypothetical protein Ao3042_03505 [Aspergillus oryzae 3.042]KDE80719.1 hypothetical protein AO1008_07016 [Aspergillus oryzae 100-8]|eukprot:EIT80018.1 hypothetical protein Ao3042_03505 [Aspergillus oryzae 3.042]
MRVTSTETSSMQRERWKACIEAEFLGIVKSTVEAATEEEKKTYKKSREGSVSMEGGAPQQSARLVEDPANQAKYEEWTDTLIPGVNDNITNIKPPCCCRKDQRCSQVFLEPSLRGMGIQMRVWFERYPNSCL